MLQVLFDSLTVCVSRAIDWYSNTYFWYSENLRFVSFAYR